MPVSVDGICWDLAVQVVDLWDDLQTIPKLRWRRRRAALLRLVEVCLEAHAAGVPIFCFVSGPVAVEVERRLVAAQAPLEGALAIT